ncbi:MAG: mechanosensitive ion channel family protein [Cyanobacteriota bacterium]
MGRISANLAIGFLALLLFAQSHQINVVGLFASLGIGGLAVAFAAQKTLEQLLGGIVIYVDRPFVVDDYIGLPDGTFGRVESIGLRSTRIRTSGKGTLVIVPNSALTQTSIENFTGAKKVMSLIHLTFHRLLSEEEKALIRQIILESTRDIFGIDSRSTDLIFRELNAQGSQPARSQAQLTLFILGSGEVSMDLRRQLVNLASEAITQKMKEHGIAFEIHDPTIYVDAPITI